MRFQSIIASIAALAIGTAIAGPLPAAQVQVQNGLVARDDDGDQRPPHVQLSCDGPSCGNGDNFGTQYGWSYKTFDNGFTANFGDLQSGYDQYTGCFIKRGGRTWDLTRNTVDGNAPTADDYVYFAVPFPVDTTPEQYTTDECDGDWSLATITITVTVAEVQPDWCGPCLAIVL